MIRRRLNTSIQSSCLYSQMRADTSLRRDSSAWSMVSSADFLSTPIPVTMIMMPNTTAMLESSHLMSCPMDCAT